MKKVAILTDSSCDLTLQEAEDLNLYVLRMPILIDNKQYREGIDISANELVSLMHEGKFAKTSQVPLGHVEAAYRELLLKYDEVIHLPISSGLSGMYNTSVMIAKMFDDKVTVIDAKSVCTPLANLCKDVRKLLDQGIEPKTIKEMVEKENILTAYIVPSDLNYLKKGGRISSGAAALAGLLKIVPILSVDNGVIDAKDKVRTHSKAINRAIELAMDVENKEDYHWMIIECEQEEIALEAKKLMKEKYGVDPTITKFGAVILSHTGPGIFGVGHQKIIK